MGREKVGNLIILWWSGDHTPWHAHVYKDKKLIAKINLEEMTVFEGKLANKTLKKIEKHLKWKGIL